MSNTKLTAKDLSNKISKLADELKTVLNDNPAGKNSNNAGPAPNQANLPKREKIAKISAEVGNYSNLWRNTEIFAGGWLESVQ